MCVAVPGKIISIDKKVAKADFLGVFRDVSLDLLDDVKTGDYVLVHAGYAIEVVETNEAEETIQLFKELKEFVQNE